MPSKTFGVIIPAAGSGNRFGADKLMFDLCGKPVLWHTLSAFQAAETVSFIVIPTRAENISVVRELAAPFSKVIAVVSGGETRQESVTRGLAALPAVDYVSVHDGARPLILPREIDRLHEEAIRYGGVSDALPVVDTSQQVDAQGFVVHTPDRAFLMAAATPQIFESSLYRVACERAVGACFTDDAGMVMVNGVSMSIFCPVAKPANASCWKASLKVMLVFT